MSITLVFLVYGLFVFFSKILYFCFLYVILFLYIKMSCNISNDVIAMAKQLFPSLFQTYSSLSEYEITKCLYECNYNREITVNTLNHKVYLFLITNA